MKWSVILLRIMCVAGLALGCQSSSENKTGTKHWEKATLVEELRIGDIDGANEYLFGRVAYVAVDREGRIYVADSQQRVVRRYDANGIFDRDIGREGEGPGEYRRLLGLCCLPNGAVAVLAVPHRIILYSADGGYLRDFRVESSVHAPRMLEYDSQSNIYVRATHGTPPIEGESEFVLLKYSSNGELLDRIRLPAKSNSHEPFTLIFPEGPLSNFEVATCSALSRLGQLVVGRNDDYAIAINSELTIKRVVERARVNPSEKSEWEAWAKFFANGGSTYTIPDVKPYYRAIYVADDGRILVHRYVAAERRDVPGRQPGDERPILHWREQTTFDVFETSGEFVGTVVVPDGVQIHAWLGESVWGVQVGDDGYQVLRWRIESQS